MLAFFKAPVEILFPQFSSIVLWLVYCWPQQLFPALGSYAIKAQFPTNTHREEACFALVIAD